MHKKTHRRRGDRRGATAWRRVGAGPGSGRGVKGAQLRTWTHDLRRRGLAPGRDGRGRRRHRDASMRRARAAGATGGGRTDPVVQGRGQTGWARRGAVGRTGAGRTGMPITAPSAGHRGARALRLPQASQPSTAPPEMGQPQSSPRPRVQSDRTLCSGDRPRRERNTGSRSTLRPCRRAQRAHACARERAASSVPLRARSLQALHACITSLIRCDTGSSLGEGAPGGGCGCRACVVPPPCPAAGGACNGDRCGAAPRHRIAGRGTGERTGRCKASVHDDMYGLKGQDGEEGGGGRVARAPPGTISGESRAVLVGRVGGAQPYKGVPNQRMHLRGSGERMVGPDGGVVGVPADPK